MQFLGEFFSFQVTHSLNRSNNVKILSGCGLRLNICFGLFFLVSVVFQVGGLWAQELSAGAKVQEKTATVGVPFRLQLFSENPEEIFVVSECDFSLLTNLTPPENPNPSLKSNGDGASEERSREFSFKPLYPGVTYLAIDRVLPNRVDKRYLYYHLTILPEAQQELIQKVIQKKKVENKKDNDEELLQLQLIKRLYEGGLLASANKDIDQYFKKYPAGAYLPQITKVKADILILQSNYAGAQKVYQDFQKKDDLKTEVRAEATYEAAKIFLSNQDKAGASEALMRITTLYKDSSFYPDALLDTGKMLAGLKRFEAAMPYFQAFQDFYKDKPKTTAPPRMDEALFGLGQVYELDPKNRDMTKASDFYEALCQTTPFSPLVAEAKKRLRYIDQNFKQLK